MADGPTRRLSEYSLTDLIGMRLTYRDKLHSEYSLTNPTRDAARRDNLHKWVRLIGAEIRWRTSNYTKVPE